MEFVEQRIQKSQENCRRSVRIREIAAELDGWHMADNVATVAGSSVGIVGGVLLLGSLAFPPLLIPGLVMTFVGVCGKIITNVTRFAVVKNLAAEAQTLCEEDARLLSAFLEEAGALLAARAGVGAVTFTLNGLAASVSFLRHTFITGAQAGGGISLKALLPTATTAVAPIRVLTGVTAGIGMALDVFSLLSSAHSLATNEKDELAEKLREIATDLEKEMTAGFIVAFIAAIIAKAQAAVAEQNENEE